MSKKQNDNPDVIEFEKINGAIDQLMERLRGICPCCLARGMIYRGSHLLADVAGDEEVVEVCLDIVDAIKQPDDGDDAMPAGSTQH